MDFKCSLCWRESVVKRVENHQTLIPKRLQETLILAQNEENIVMRENIPIDLDK